ncbi:GTPase-activating Rap/Ran-GAP domain-like protein 3 isoform X2 [Lingula anatina]|uniref:GTPase-activating Rap/Ran-GAP domain-like protein 3 n=1 Tax=Lingula anatina TaxID=7574 RepID=A0A1S3K6C4_LINAN|nr:GTPase-activating Rap/Ran-GAP domain-like protein 3 isoform X2 [Lingula anatina]|eukprot:XP_013417806.1 GTPase-activating Rap/Ran-GAP domain-like protein 3 isoform X2 [Lingula anatina]
MSDSRSRAFTYEGATFNVIKYRDKRSEQRKKACGSHIAARTTASLPANLQTRGMSHPVHQTVRLTRSSPASDLAARRGMFSRKHYGSVELLTSSESEGTIHTAAGRFRIETGEFEHDEFPSPLGSPVHVENPEYQTRWYFKYFLGKMHQNYVGLDADKEPFILSVVVTDANNHNVPQYRAILWRKQGARKICLPYDPTKPKTVKGILGHFDMPKVEKGPREIYNAEVQKELLVLEEQEGSVNFKFGVTYCIEGQISDDEMYGNEKGSSSFDKFIHLLGDRIKLKGWDRFKGGLDVKSNSTGDDSVYTVYEGHEIMFHVSSLLPYSTDNKQQVERKRHIGNDIVNIIYVEMNSDQQPSFRPSMMKTHFTHIYALVVYEKDTDKYRLNVYSAESVPLFGPPLPTPAVFADHAEFRDFLLVKCINGEKAALCTPVFAQKRVRTLDMLIRNTYDNHMVEVNKNTMLNRRAFSDVIPDYQHGSRRKEEARKLEFVRVGQALKLNIILKGDAPTSLITTGMLKREPWEPQCFYHSFPNEIICGDSWGDKLIIVTEVGTMVIEEGCIPRLIFDRTVSIKQIDVVEPHGLIIFRPEKGKDSKIHVFRLADFEGRTNSIVRTKLDSRDHKIERSKGCHLYALSRPGGSHLRMVIAIGKRLLVMSWKHSAAWSAWCVSNDTETVDGFQFLRELQSYETPELITLIDGPRGDNQICVGYKHQYDLINEKNGDTLHLHHVDASKVKLVSAIDIYEDSEAELLLCYNHVCHFQKLTEDNSNEFDFLWNSQPCSIVCAFPYILALTPDTMEIRLIINGSLVQTVTYPRLGLITSKCDIYFASTAMGYHSSDKCKEKESDNNTPPVSPGIGRVYNIFKIPITSLVGNLAPQDCTTPSPNPTPPLLAPVVPTEDDQPPVHPRSPRIKRSPLLRTRRLDSLSQMHVLDPKERHYSSGSDSGIVSHSPPPHSPMKVSISVDSEDSEFV